MFFKAKPNVQAAEKARVELQLAQIFECIGYDRFRLPVLSIKSLLQYCESEPAVDPAVEAIGKHLSHDVSGLRWKIEPKPVEKCGGGG